MAVWDAFLTGEDRTVLRRWRTRAPTGVGGAPALLVVDMQVAMCGLDAPIDEQPDEFPFACGSRAWRAIEAQRRLLDAARSAAVPVVYSKLVYRPEQGLPRADAESPLSILNPLSEIPEAIARRPGDLIVEKQLPSCFAYTNLSLMLRDKGVDSLLVVGNSTSGCVRATCIDALALGLKVSVVAEGTFDRIELSHAASLFDLQFKYCDVIGLDEALDDLAERGVG